MQNFAHVVDLFFNKIHLLFVNKLSKLIIWESLHFCIFKQSRILFCYCLQCFVFFQFMPWLLIMYFQIDISNLSEQIKFLLK